MFSRNTFGAPRAAHGFGSDDFNQDDLGAQAGRQAEYQDLARRLVNAGVSMKALASYFRDHGREILSDAPAGDGNTALAMKSITKAKAAITKAEAVDEDDDADEDDQADRDSACEKAASALRKAKKSLADAIECDEDEDLIEKARSSLKKAKRDLEALKSRPGRTAEDRALVDLDTKTTATLKSVQAWEKSVGDLSRTGNSDADIAAAVKAGTMLSSSVQDVLGAIGGIEKSEANSQKYDALVAKADQIRKTIVGIGSMLGGVRGSGFPPGGPVVHKAGGPANYMQRIVEADDRLTDAQRLTAKTLASRLAAAKGDAALTKSVRESIAKQGVTIRSLFD